MEGMSYEQQMDAYMDWATRIPVEYCTACGKVQATDSQRGVGITLISCGVCHRWIENEYDED